MAETLVTVSEASEPLIRLNGDSPARTNRLSLLLGRAFGRRGASTLVRETAAMQLEERRADWGYSKPVIALDITWNLAFTIVSVVMIICTLNEKPNTPIRIWILGYALQCVVHVVMVWLECRRRSNRRNRNFEDGITRTSDSDVNNSEDEGGDSAGLRSGNRSRLVTIKLLIKIIKQSNYY